MNAKSSSTLRHSKAKLCPVCGAGTKGCSTRDDGQVFCRGEVVDVAAWTRLTKVGPDKAGFHHYRHADDGHRVTGNSRCKNPTIQGVPLSWNEQATKFQKEIGSKHIHERIAGNLELPVESFDAGMPLIGMGYTEHAIKDDASGNWVGAVTFPMFNGKAEATGITKRFDRPVSINGADPTNKHTMKGSSLGLLLGKDWKTRPGPLFVPEGGSDVVSLSLCDLAAVGRPSNVTGAELLADLCRDVPTGRKIIVVGENDVRFDEVQGRDLWPGKDGVECVAPKLAELLNRPVHKAYPPEGIKDCRELVREMIAGQADALDLNAVGAEIRARLEATAVEVLVPVPDSASLIAAKALPRIIINDRQYRDVESDAAQALIASNNPPSVFVGNGGGLIDLQRFEPGCPPRARELDGPAMRSIFARVADWFRLERTRKDDVITNEFPPQALLTSFPARGDWPGLPRLLSIVPYPVFSSKWELIAKEGYHADSGIFCFMGDLALPPIPMKPTAYEALAAKELILTDLLGDFPFVDASSQAHAVAMLLLPLVRHTINGPTPLSVVDAPTEGTGKSLLVEASMLVTLGEVPDAMTADMKEEERDKTLLALLLEGQPIVFFDNANRKLDSASFANMLTARYKRGRILGESRTVQAKVNVCWVLTGNNFTSSREMSRRLYWTRIDAQLESPSRRTGFRHPDLLEWVRENRPRLLAALITMIRHWRATGAIPGKATLGKFEAWAKTIGGILAANGITGFLENAETFRKRCVDGVGQMNEFVKAWWAGFGSNAVTTGDLFDVAKTTLESMLKSEKEDGKKTQLGLFIKKNIDRVVGRFRITVVLNADGEQESDHSGKPKYRLEEVGKEEKAAERESPNLLDDIPP